MNTALHIDLEEVSCCVCGSKSSTSFATGADFEYETCADTFHMVRCEKCGNVYLNPRPTESALPVIYPSNYYSYNYESTINPIAIRAKAFLDGRKVHSWLTYCSKTDPGNILDVGCGDGRYLKMLHQLGIEKSRLFGVELSAQQIESLNAIGYNGHYGRVEEVAQNLPPRSFDVITMLQVLEHVSNPSSVIASLAGLLKDDGVLVIETPNINSLDVDLFRGSYWGGYHFPRHFNIFSENSLRELLARHELEVLSIRFLPAHSFWIFSLHHAAKHQLRSAAVARFCNPHQNLLLLSIFTAFDLVRAKLGFKTSNIQVIAKRRPVTIA